MKKLIALTTIIGLSLCAAVGQTATNAAPSATFTNGVTVQVPLNDLQYNQLQYIMRAKSLTNVPPAQVVTNYMKLDFNGEGKVVLGTRRARIMRNLQGATDAQLSQVEAALSP